MGCKQFIKLTGYLAYGYNDCYQGYCYYSDMSIMDEKVGKGLSIF